MARHWMFVPCISLLSIGGFVTATDAKNIKVAVVQTVIEDTLAKNEAKLLHFVDQAGDARCDIVIFPENALYWSEQAVDHPTKSDLDAAIGRIGQHARRARLAVVFGTAYKTSDEGPYHNHGVVFDDHGNRLIFYRKNIDVPRSFDVAGVTCNLAVCSDRGYLEYSDLPALVERSRLIIDTSGGHGGDDGGDELPLIRYRPWAKRTGAYVIVSNPVHDDTDFMGRSPWGGGSAIVNPDGSIRDQRRYEKDVMMIHEVDSDDATLFQADRRRNHPLLKTFWDMGDKLLESRTIGEGPRVTPLVSAVRDVKIAAAQMACSTDIRDNTFRIRKFIAEAADQGADVVVFPELALTGARGTDVVAATQASLDAALSEICQSAKAGTIYVIVGMPYFIDGARRNCAVVIGDDGSVKTRYAQIVNGRGDLFTAGKSTQAMWFQLKGVHSIVTVGDDADWIEIPDLAANRGMCLHFHISYDHDSSQETAIVRKQRNLIALAYAKYGAIINAADPSSLASPSLPASGVSMIVSREGGHNQPAPKGLEYYLPYQTSVVKSAGAAEQMILATRKTVRVNDLDLDRYWRNRNRKSRGDGGWHDWIRHGAMLIGKRAGDS